MSSATTVKGAPSKSIYDTSVYINAIRSRAYYEALLPQFAHSLPTTYFCAVVAQELNAGCRTPHAHERVESFIAPFRRVGRLVTPAFADWEEAGAVLARLLQDRSDLKDKLPSLVNDILIALCGLRIGAVIYTANETDFALIRLYKRFRYKLLT
jgi:predicted nucleic acid-binding protein